MDRSLVDNFLNLTLPSSYNESSEDRGSQDLGSLLDTLKRLQSDFPTKGIRPAKSIGDNITHIYYLNHRILTSTST